MLRAMRSTLNLFSRCSIRYSTSPFKRLGARSAKNMSKQHQDQMTSTFSRMLDDVESIKTFWSTSPTNPTTRNPLADRETLTGYRDLVTYVNAPLQLNASQLTSSKFGPEISEIYMPIITDASNAMVG